MNSRLTLLLSALLMTVFGCSTAGINATNGASSAAESSLTTSQSSSSSICTGALVGGSFVDCRDGQAYTYVTLGTQTWMAQNLNYGKMIPSTQDQSDSGFTEKYCYNDSASYCKLYGGLYQWNEAAAWPSTSSSSSSSLTGICPTGWHLPSTAEVNTLIAYAGSFVAATVLKSTHYWSLASGTDNDQFGMLPAGDRAYDRRGYEKLNGTGYLWTSTTTSTSKTYDIEFDDNSAKILQVSSWNTYGLSVRCIMNP